MNGRTSKKPLNPLLHLKQANNKKIFQFKSIQQFIQQHNYDIMFTTLIGKIRFTKIGQWNANELSY